MVKIKTGLILVILNLCFILFGCTNESKTEKLNPYNLDITQSKDAYDREVKQNPDWKLEDLSKIRGIYLDIRYATTNNFTGKVIYLSPRAFARMPVFDALQKVQDSLSHFMIGLKIYDAYRPYAASLKFFEVYPDTNFVANPRNGSRHNRGCAVDLTLVELSTGKELPMPTEYDNFTEKAHPNYKDLPDTVLTNRKLLFGIMEHFGFSYYPTEWWHFDYKGWEKYKLLDLTFEELERR